MADNQGTQTVTVPGVGDIDFPDHMSPDEMSQAIQKNFPHLGEMAKTAQANKGRALSSAIGQAAFGMPAPARPRGLFQQPTPATPDLAKLPLLPATPGRDIATPEGDQRRQQLSQFKRMTGAGQQEFQGEIESSPELGFDRANLPLQGPATPQEANATAPLSQRLSQKELAEQYRQRRISRPLSKENTAITKGAAAKITADQAAQGPDLYDQIAHKPMLGPWLQANYGWDPTEFVKGLVAPTQPRGLGPGDTTSEKIAKGAARGAISTAEGLSTPENAGLMGVMTVAPELAPELAPLGKMADLMFTGQMGYGAAKQGAEAVQKARAGDIGGAAEAGTGALTNAAFAGLGALHLGREAVAGRMADQIISEREKAATQSAQTVPSAMVPPSEGPTGQPLTERRAGTRKRVADMSPDELRIDALTNKASGLPNERAFDELQEDKPAKVVGYSDVNRLKYVNDNFGHAAGDALIKAKGDALKEAGVDAYHLHGDEFAYRGDDQDALKAQLDKAKQIFAAKEIPVQTAEGPATLKGGDFAYGFGEDKATADLAMKKAKDTDRESRGQMQVIKPEKTVAAEQPQAIIPSEAKPVVTDQPVAAAEPPKVTADKYEGPLRKLVGSWMKTKQLQAAAKDRLHVEYALQAIGPENDGVLGDKKVAPSGLSKDRLGMVEAVSKVLGITPKDLWERNYRLTDDQVKQLQAELKRGIHTMPLKELVPDHPETKFADKAAYPLADINQANAQVAGVSGAKDLWRKATPEEQAKHKESVAKPITGGEAVGEGLTVKGRRKAEAEGSVRRGGKDAQTLRDEHDAMQGVLDRHAKQVMGKIQELLPEWRAARVNTPEASQLAKDIAAVDRSSRTGIPKELYAKEHLEPKAGQTAAPTRVQESIPSTEAAPKEQSAQGATAAPQSEGTSPEFLDSIEKLHEDLRAKHGEENINPALAQLFDATRAKYTDPGTIFKVYKKAVEKFQDLMDKGEKDPVKGAISATIDKFPSEGTQTTLYANPVQAIWDKTFGFKKPVNNVRFPKVNLPEAPLSDFTADLSTQAKPDMKAEFDAYVANERKRVTEAAQDMPNNIKKALSAVGQFTKEAWDYWKNRPGLSPLQWGLGGRSLKLQADAIVMHKFVDAVNKLHPDVSRREAMVNYLQAGGGVRPDRDVNAELQLKANQFATRSDNARLKKGYLDAQNLTPSEKKTIADYRTYEADMRQKEEAAGLELHARENYIRQIWDTDSFTRKKVDAFFHAGSFTTSGAFMKERKFEDYFEGEMEGLKPKRKDFGYLVTARARASAEVLANRSLIEMLYREKMPDGRKIAMPDGIGVPQGTITNPDGTQSKGAILIKQAKPGDAVLDDGRKYVQINHPAFQNWKWVGEAEGGLNADGSPKAGTTLLYKGNMLVHPDVAKQLQRVLEPSTIRQNPIGKAALKMSSIGKQTLLIGLFHPVQLGIHFTEHAMEGGTTWRTMKALNPGAKPLIDLDNDITQQQLVIHGLKVADFNAEAMWDEGVMSRGFANAAPFIGKPLAALHDAMFQRYIPNLKMSMALDAVERNSSRYLDKFTQQEFAKSGNARQAAILAKSRVYRMTADQMNSAFGGLNWDFLPVSKTQQDMARLMVLAPDFLLARMQFVGDTFRPGGAESAKAFWTGALIQYTAARVFNAAMNDGDAKWDIHDWNKFIAGHHEYSLRTVQGDTMDSILDWRRFTSHRLNPLTLRPAFELATQRDAFGHPASAGQMLYDFGKNFVPMPLQGGMDAVFGKNVGRRDESIADTLAQSLGLQRRQYRSPAQREVFTKFDNLQGNSTQDDLALEQKNTFRELRQKYEQGKLTDLDIEHALDAGTLKTSEKKYLLKTYRETRLVREARHLEPNEVLHAWSIGTPAEKMELLPVARAKANKLPENLREPAIQKLENFIDSLPEDKQDKLLEEGQRELDYEYPPPPKDKDDKDDQ